ncbi:MAG TPA: hypothetical protein VEX17_02980, partial [Bacillales bacterium]|nr:hypothetical protein [Bacillales bacterium]
SIIICVKLNSFSGYIWGYFFTNHTYLLFLQIMFLSNHNHTDSKTIRHYFCFPDSEIDELFKRDVKKTGLSPPTIWGFSGIVLIRS